MYGWDDVECPNCSENIAVHKTWHPLDYVEREPEGWMPRSLFVIASDRLLHNCPVVDPQRTRIRRAQGMVSAQAGCSMSDALGLMRSTAEATDLTIDEVAACVLDRSVRFDEEGPRG